MYASQRQISAFCMQKVDNKVFLFYSIEDFGSVAPTSASDVPDEIVSILVSLPCQKECHGGSAVPLLKNNQHQALQPGKRGGKQLNKALPPTAIGPLGTAHLIDDDTLRGRGQSGRLGTDILPQGGW